MGDATSTGAPSRLSPEECVNRVAVRGYHRRVATEAAAAWQDFVSLIGAASVRLGERTAPLRAAWDSPAGAAFCRFLDEVVTALDSLAGQDREVPELIRGCVGACDAAIDGMHWPTGFNDDVRTMRQQVKRRGTANRFSPGQFDGHEPAEGNPAAYRALDEEYERVALALGRFDPPSLSTFDVPATDPRAAGMGGSGSGLNAVSGPNAANTNAAIKPFSAPQLDRPPHNDEDPPDDDEDPPYDPGDPSRYGPASAGGLGGGPEPDPAANSLSGRTPPPPDSKLAGANAAPGVKGQMGGTFMPFMPGMGAGANQGQGSGGPLCTDDSGWLDTPECSTGVIT